MGQVVYCKLNVNLESVSGIKAKIAKLDQIIDALFTTALTSVENGNIVEYELDTGQTRTNVTYSRVQDVQASIKRYEDLRTFYVNKLQPKYVRLVDAGNFRRKF